MPPFSKVEFALDRCIEPQAFEDLCVELLIRDGYRDIVPAGGRRDHGRDAECRTWVGARVEIGTAFQFSLDLKWEQKIRRDIPTILRHHANIRSVVFVTSQTVTIEKQDKLRNELRQDIGIELVIYDRGWMKTRLECYHHDLAQKYLDVTPEETVSYVETQIELYGVNDDNADELFNNHPPETIRASLIARTQKNGGLGAWKSLAHVENHLRNYQAALSACVKAEGFDPEDVNIKLLKAAIWAEWGILNRSKPLLIKAKAVYGWAVEKLGRSVDYFNLANVQSELEEVEDAETNFRKSLEIESDSAKAWKNLGSVLFKKGEHQEELECYDKALKLDSSLVEAYLCKANTLRHIYKDAKSALRLFETAYRLDPNLNSRWKHTPYWYAMTLADVGRPSEALGQVNSALENSPDSPYLLELKAALLSHLWDESPSKYSDLALDYFRFRVESIYHDYSALSMLCNILIKRGSPNEAWQHIDTNLGLEPGLLRKYAECAHITVEQIGPAFAQATQYADFREDSRIKDHFIRLTEFGLEPCRRMEPVLYHLLMVPHKLMHDGIREGVEAGSTDIILNLFHEGLKQVSDVIISQGSQWLSDNKPEEAEEQARLMSLGILYIADVVVTEVSRLYGYYLGKFNFSLGDELDAGAFIPDDFTSEVGLRFFELVALEWGVGES